MQLTNRQWQELHKALSRVPVLDEPCRRQVPHLLHRVTATFPEIGEEGLNLLARLRRIAEITECRASVIQE